MCAGYEDEAKRFLIDVLNISDADGIPYMGWQYEENIFWPEEKPSWTAALMLSVDCVIDYSDASIYLYLTNNQFLRQAKVSTLS